MEKKDGKKWKKKRIGENRFTKSKEMIKKAGRNEKYAR